MTKDKKNIDLLFEEGLKGFKEKPPVYAWNKLDKGLSAAGSKKTINWLRLAAAIVLIFLAFGAGYFYATYFNDEQPEIVRENTPVEIENLIQPKDLITDNEQNVGSNKSQDITPTDNTIYPDNSNTLISDNNADNFVSNDNLFEDVSDNTGQIIALSELQNNNSYDENISLTSLMIQIRSLITVRCIGIVR